MLKLILRFFMFDRKSCSKHNSANKFQTCQKKRIELKQNVTNTVTIIFQCKSIDRLEGSRVSNTLHVMTGKARDNFKCMSVGRFTKIGTNNQI